MQLRLILMSAALMAALLTGSACSGGAPEPAETTETAEATAARAEAATPAPAGEVVIPRIVDEDGLTTVEIAERLRPSIVRIQTEVAGVDIFGRVIPGQGVGTGVIFDASGHIVTNNHVIIGNNNRPAETITVTLFDQRTARATVVGGDAATDLAVLKIDAGGLVPAAFADPETLQVGQDVVAIGFALDLEGAPTVTRGVLSAKNRTINEDPYTIPDAIQTDAGINPGNSGGALVNARGEVVGINTAIIRGAQNIGFAISVSLVQPIVAHLLESGQVERAYLGIASVDMNAAIARNFGTPIEKGIAVTAVGSDSPAARAGLRVNDVVVRIDGAEISNNGQLLALLAERLPGATITLTFYRGSAAQDVQIILTSRPNE